MISAFPTGACRAEARVASNRPATKPAAANVLQQQARFDTFLTRYNHERPHQALNMKVPSELYTSTDQPYEGVGDLD